MCKENGQLYGMRDYALYDQKIITKEVRKSTMLTIDKLCYNSKLRYENAAEKFTFAMLTLCICVMSKSVAVAGIVLLTAGYLTVVKGGISLEKYIKFFTVPLIFLLLSTLAILFHISREPMDFFAIPIGDWYLTVGKEGFLRSTTDYDSSWRSVLPVLFIFYHTHA